MRKRNALGQFSKTGRHRAKKSKGHKTPARSKKTGRFVKR